MCIATVLCWGRGRDCTMMYYQDSGSLHRLKLRSNYGSETKFIIMLPRHRLGAWLVKLAPFNLLLQLSLLRLTCGRVVT